MKKKTIAYILITILVATPYVALTYTYIPNANFLTAFGVLGLLFLIFMFISTILLEPKK
jgi:hypothetical protein